MLGVKMAERMTDVKEGTQVWRNRNHKPGSDRTTQVLNSLCGNWLEVTGVSKPGNDKPTRALNKMCGKWFIVKSVSTQHIELAPRGSDDSIVYFVSSEDFATPGYFG